MAVRHVETFTFELPLDAVDPGDSTVAVTMGRDALDQLWDDIGVALGKGRRGAAMFHQEYPEPAMFTEPHPSDTSISIEEALAAMQVQEQVMQHTAPPNQPRGSAIGNSHV